MNALADFNTVFQDEVPNYHSSGSSTSSLHMRLPRIRVQNNRSEWAKKLEDRFDELTSLPKGWDGYDGVPVSFTCAQFAANLVERLYVKGVGVPQLVPGADGTLQLEWHMNQYNLEIDVLAPYEVVATLYDHLTEQEQEIEVQTDFTELSEWVISLSQDRQPVQMEA